MTDAPPRDPEPPSPDAARLLDALRTAFAGRREPDRLHELPPGTPHPDVDDAEAFAGLDWTTLTVDHLERYHCGIHLLAPEAFVRFLPRILAVGVREDAVGLLAQDTIVGQLDRSPRPDWWDEGFAARWTGLTRAEIEAVQRWLLWLQERDPAGYHENTFDRAFDTLTLLAETAPDRA